MAATLIVETGSGNPDANSYVTADYVDDYLVSRGVVVPPTEKLIPLIILAADFMECIPRYKGRKTNPDQALAYPRAGLRSNGQPLPEDSIPAQLKKAQAQLVMDQVQSGKPLLSSKTEYVLKRRTLGPLTQEWATGNSQQVQGAQPHPRFWALMQDFLNGIGGSEVIR